MIDSSSDIEPLARTVEDNGDVYFVPAFSGLFTPYWRSDARGVITGLTRFANRGHIARAVLEATAYQTKEVIDAMEASSGVHLSSLKVDGGMVFNDLLMQFQADILDVPVIRPQITETTALGAAYAAGLTVGYWRGIEELRSNWIKEKEWQPNMALEKRSQLLESWKKQWKGPSDGNNHPTCFLLGFAFVFLMNELFRTLRSNHHPGDQSQNALPGKNNSRQNDSLTCLDLGSKISTRAVKIWHYSLKERG